jgi:hypothetical protein
MSDGGDRFDKLRELDEQTQTDGIEEPSSDGTGKSTGADSTTESPSDRTTADSSDSAARDDFEASPDDGESPADEPPFTFDEAKQRPLYARPAAWDAFEDALVLEVERLLREHDVRNAEKRELHDAALRVAARHPEEIADELLSGRGLDRDD